MSETTVAKKKIIKLGYQAPKGRRLRYCFTQAMVKDMHYCASHDFWFDSEEQNKSLHEGKSCVATDCRFQEGRNNFYREGFMFYTNRHYGKSLKAVMRMVRKTRNLPVGTIVKINTPFFDIGRKSKKSFSFAYNFKITKENKFAPEYEVNKPSFFKNFATDQKAKELTDLLRANGFLVSVHSENANFISSMISTAAARMGDHYEADNEEGEYATAYGHGLRVGYSSGKDSFRGYSSGVDKVLFDKWDEFNKWSRCCGISKEMSNEEILNILLNVKNENEN